MDLQVQASSTIWRETSVEEAGREGIWGNHKQGEQHTSQGSDTVTRYLIILHYHEDRSDVKDNWTWLDKSKASLVYKRIGKQGKYLEVFVHIVF